MTTVNIRKRAHILGAVQVILILSGSISPNAKAYDTVTHGAMTAKAFEKSTLYQGIHGIIFY